jgi:phosphatidylserine/phosphatidylglycerophosphate/cardiolipin synthase-like enzyme
MGVADTGSATRRTRITGGTRSSRSPVPSVRALEGSFYENWIETGGCRRRRSIRNAAARHRRAVVVVWSNPMSGASNVKLMYLLAIGAARKTIDIQSPYITHDPTPRGACSRRVNAASDPHAHRGPITDAMPVKHASRSLVSDVAR